MNWTEMARLLNKHAPARFAGICTLIEMLTDEIAVTMEELIAASTEAQKSSDYSKAKELLELQIELDSKKTALRELWDHAIGPLLPVSEQAEQRKPVRGEELETGEKHSLFKSNEDHSQNSLSEDWTFKKPEHFVYRGIRYPEKQWSTMLIHLLGLVHKENPDILHSMERDGFTSGMRGLKLSKDKSSLRRPGQIRGTQIWVETNLNANSIRDAIVSILKIYGIPFSDFSVSFGRDFSERHIAQSR